MATKSIFRDVANAVAGLLDFDSPAQLIKAGDMLGNKLAWWRGKYRGYTLDVRLYHTNVNQLIVGITIVAPADIPVPDDASSAFIRAALWLCGFNVDTIKFAPTLKIVGQMNVGEYDFTDGSCDHVAIVYDIVHRNVETLISFVNNLGR